MRQILLSILIVPLMLLQTLEAKNPIESPTFDDIVKELIGDQKRVYDDTNIKIKVPSFADNPLQVPIFVDAKKIKDAQEMIIFADLNPIPLIMKTKVEDILPVFGTNIKVAQETPLRALILDSKGVWHIASKIIHSEGGGCDVSSQANSGNSDFADNLGKSKGKTFDKKEVTRIKCSIFHPMETGLLFGTTEFYINNVFLKDGEKELAKLEITSVISENPRFTLEVKKPTKDFQFQFLDNDGNEFALDIQ